MRKKIFTFLLALIASIGMMWAAPAVAINGKLPGKFSVSATKKVYFSQGNLQYQASTNTWRFAEHQYDFIGDAAGNNTESGRNTQSDWIDLFGWATSGNSASGTAYQPWQSSTTDSEYGPAITSGQWTYANSDWGINPISNGGNVANSWRTLTQEEWDYILNERETEYRFCYAKLSIGDGLGYGLIILPDDWDPSYYALSPESMNQGNHSYDSNVISEEDWTNSLEAHGAVFLPVTGMRYNGNEVTGLDDDKIGLYWSSIAAERHEVIEDPEEDPMIINIVNAAYNLAFNGGWYIRANQVTTRSRGLAVRLVYTEPSGDPTLQVTELEVPGSWNHDFTHLTASDFPGFVAASAAEAQAWSGAPKSGSSYLIYAFEDDEAKVCHFEDGHFIELGAIADRDDIYYRSGQGYQFYYTGTAPVYTLLTTITVQLNGWNTEVIYTDPNVATIATSCDVSAYQAYDPSISGYYVAWRANSPGSNNELLCVLPKEGYTITKVEFTHNNDASNKTTVTNAPFKYDLSYGNNNISKIEVYGEAETPAAPVVVASWESNSECNVVLTSDGKLTVSKLDYDGIMEDMNSYQSSKWRCFSDLITSIEVQEGVTHIGNYAFYNLQNVTSVSLPNSLTSIGDGAFMDCSITGDLVLPENLESIGEKCFSMVPKSLSTISVPASVTSIGKCAFENKGASNKTSTNVLTAINVAAANPNYCSVDGILYSKDMTTLIAYPAGKTATAYEIPATVTEIKYNALYSCVNITDLTIPAGTSVIEENGGSNIVAFSGCYGLENIHNNATTPQSIYRVLSYWEGQGQDQINLYVPSGLGATYEAADGWKELNIIDPSTPAPTPSGDKLPGAFTVDNTGKQVNFSKGNVQYVGGSWKFADNQWDMIGNAQANDNRDLFGWGTGSEPNKTTEYEPYYTTFTDWGTNFGEGWRTLTKDEWIYLLETRDNAANLRTLATVNSVKGLILMPDGWTASGVELAVTIVNYTSNMINESNWATLASQGCVFLPAAGYRVGDEVSGVGSEGYYFSSTNHSDNHAAHMSFETNTVTGDQYTFAYCGNSVRLVTDAGGSTPTPTPTSTDEQVVTKEDPENPGTYYYSTFFHSTQNYKLSNDGTEAFIADLSGSDLVLTKIAEGAQVIPANTAVIFRKSGSADPVVLTPTEENGISVNPDDNSLKGVDAVTAVTSIDGLTTTNCYVLSGTNEHGVGFYRINSENLKAHKAYVKYAGLQNNAPKRMRFVFNQEQIATGIDNANADIKAEKRIENGVLIIIKNGVRYNVQGQIVK